MKSSVIVATPLIYFLPFTFGYFLYLSPIFLITRIFGISEFIFLGKPGDFFPTPNIKGWVFLVLAWMITGAFLGFLVYKLREFHAKKKNESISLNFSALITVLFLQILTAIIFLFLPV